MDDGTARIELRRKNGPSMWTVVDLADLDRVNEHQWRPLVGKRTTYAYTNIAAPGRDRAFLYLHRLLTNAPKGADVDHIDHDGLNNRRSNLRLATASQNLGNARNLRGGSSRFKGVSWASKDRRWRAQIRVNGHGRHIGQYATEEEAARAYDAAALAAWGEFAFLNRPPRWHRGLIPDATTAGQSTPP